MITIYCEILKGSSSIRWYEIFSGQIRFDLNLQYYFDFCCKRIFFCVNTYWKPERRRKIDKINLNFYAKKKHRIEILKKVRNKFATKYIKNYTSNISTEYDEISAHDYF